MEKKLKVLIGDDKTEFGQTCANVLKSYGLDVSLCEKDGRKLVSMIEQKKPDVVLADVFMPSLDILGVMENIKNMENKPMVMAMSSFDNPKLEKETLNSGVS